MLIAQPLQIATSDSDLKRRLACHWPDGCSSPKAMKETFRRLWTFLRAYRSTLLLEASTYVSQVVVFCLVAILMSNLLQDEKVLTELITCRIGQTFWREIACTFLASLTWLGALLVTSACLPSKTWTRFIREVLNELPRTIYFFGSSVSGLLLAAAIAEWFHPALRHFAYEFSKAAVLWAFVAFLYGFMLKLMLQAGEKEVVEPPCSGPRQQADDGS